MTRPSLTPSLLNASDFAAVAADLLRRSIASGGILAGANRPISLSPNGAFNEGNADEIANKLSSNNAKLVVRVFDEKK